MADMRSDLVLTTYWDGFTGVSGLVLVAGVVRDCWEATMTCPEFFLLAFSNAGAFLPQYGGPCPERRR